MLLLNSHRVPGSLPARNLLLRALPKDGLGRIFPYLQRVELPHRTIVLRSDSSVEFVYFVEAGTVSMISTLENGAEIEVGMVGFEGFIGLSVLLGAPTSPIEGVVQVSGTALRLSATAFRAALSDIPELRNLLLRYVDGFHVQVSQTATCNSHHQIEQRLARWILMTHDRVEGDHFLMKQNFMALMLGVQRPGVTLALGVLQRAGLVRHGKGIMEVLDRSGLEAASCECHKRVQRRFEWLMGSRPH